VIGHLTSAFELESYFFHFFAFLCLCRQLSAEAFLFSGCQCVHPFMYSSLCDNIQKFVNMISYKLLVRISRDLHLRSSWRQKWTS